MNKKQNLFKKNVIIVLVFSMILTFTGCGLQGLGLMGEILENVENQEDDEGEMSSTPDLSDDLERSDSTILEPEVDPMNIKVTERPVSVQDHVIIVQDEINSYYGLINDRGKEILPPQYGDMKFITVNEYEPKTYVVVQEKGSYGVYDLAGNQIVTAEYDDITGLDYADGFIVRYRDTYGVMDLTGAELIPMQYVSIACSTQGIIAALQEKEEACQCDLYDVSGALYNSFLVENDLGEVTVEFYGYGEYITVSYLRDGIGFSKSTRYNYDLNGTRIEEGPRQESIGEGYFYCVDGGQLLIVDGKSGEIVASVKLENEQDTVIESSNLTEDRSTGIFYGYIVTAIDKKEGREKTVYFLSLDDAIHISVYCKPEIGALIFDFDQGTAFSAQDGHLFITDSIGQRTELSAPHTSWHPLTNCAIVTNHEYIYVIDKEGNTILSEEGYVNYSSTHLDTFMTLPYEVQQNESIPTDGLFVLETADGSKQIIDSNGKEIVPLGNTYRDVILKNAQGEYQQNYSLLLDETAGKYFFIDNPKSRVLQMADDVETELLDKILNEVGYILTDEGSNQLYGIFPAEQGYEIVILAYLDQLL